MRFLKLCCGIWDDDALRCYGIEEKLAQFSMHVRYKNKRQAEGTMSADVSILNDDDNNNDNNNDTENNNNIQGQNRISRTSSSIPWPEYGNDPIRYSTRHSSTNLMSSMKSLLNPFLLQMYIINDYAINL